ncbi:MAG: hypothetical protein EOO05_15075 [Chitinophagaceae bacterium]|nr:MAG: hypothetical protein EOO05_15075 [Chitinophagaceae bacterium]
MLEFLDHRFFQEQDIYLVPFCLLLLLVGALAVRRKYKDQVIEKYFLPALFLRFACAIGYAAVVYFYYGFGDTTLYYLATSDMRGALAVDSSVWSDIYLNISLDPNSALYTYFMYDNGVGTHAYMLNNSNFMVPRFALPFSFLFGNSYLCISFCMAFYSFGGCWRIFKMFVEQYPQLHKKLAIAVLFLPSVLFWGGSLVKDSISLGSLGYVLYGLYNIFLVRRKMLSSTVIVLLAGFILYVTKPYILLCLVPTFLLWVFIQYRSRISNSSVRQFSTVFLGVVGLALMVFLMQQLTATEIASQYSSDKILSTVQGVQGSFSVEESSGSNFNVSSVNNSPFGLLLLFPLGIISTLFRPFPWEAVNPLMILSSLEAFAFLFLTIMVFRRVGFRQFWSIIGKDPALLFCLLYSVLFAGIIGATTTNFGALVRYKIPCIPFYLIMIFVVMHRSGKFSPDIVFSKKFF